MPPLSWSPGRAAATNAAPTVLPRLYATVVGAAALLTLAATALPGRLALRVRPMEAATFRQ
ncbi:hypothetical protein OG978_30280 [Streptomyces sp. NBC_01591]|uniref:hypothetical protein n=1 Tax=Streptomyces sp. NBC_01591 TaxID=2975888 RepID=UPI002DDC6770|nr:hypothetical protein [Streptomyces sp. NBC_01591]WSD71292.1 hypothetical protein OG978_30280 [Streptomyces sp. NBC_01591]